MTLVLVVHFPSDLANLQVKFRVFILFSFFLLENLAGGLFSHRGQYNSDFFGTEFASFALGCQLFNRLSVLLG
jgi:hypothetical protein